ncbi:MAG TPA: translocation/assembly module TamB domain-containing protein, partial [Ignavibacteriaceae bacterium]
KIALIKDENGELNISKLTEPSGEETEPADTTSSPFTFKIEAADLTLNNVEFLLQSESKKNSTEYYDHPDFNDFRLKNINLNLYAFADFMNEEYMLKINHLNVEPNLKNFLLSDFSIDAMVVEDETWIRELRLITGKSDITVNAALSGYNLLGDNQNQHFDDAQLKLDLEALNFNFDDLSTFIEATDLLKGNVSTELNTAGSFKFLEIKKLLVGGENTRLEGTGHLGNITSGSNMEINFRFTNSFVDQNYVKNLLHTIELPVYSEYGSLRFDTLYFSGKPLNFRSGINLRTDKGNVDLTANLDLEKDDMVYDINFSGNNFDLNPVASIPSHLNFTGKVSGTGTDPETMKADVIIEAENSEFFYNALQDFSFISSASDGKLNLDLNLLSDRSSLDFSADLEMNNFEKPAYNFKSEVRGLDISSFTNDPSLKSNLNFQLSGEGENFSPKLLNLFLVLSLDSTEISGLNIESTRLIADVRSDTSERVINIISDLADFTFTGKFDIEELVELLTVESALIASTIENKINEIQPPESYVDIQDFQSVMEETYPEISDDIINSEINLNYLVEFKDFELLTLMFGTSEMEISGEITGDIKTTPDLVELSMNTDIEFFKFWDGEGLIYFSNLKLNSSLEDKISDLSFKNFKMDTEINADRIFAGSEFDELDFKLLISETNAELYFSTLIDNDASILLSGSSSFPEDFLEMNFDDIRLKYNDYRLQNSDDIVIYFSDDNIEFKQFTLTHDPGDFNISGSFSFTGFEDLSVSFSNFNLKDIAVQMLELEPQKSPDAIFGLSAEYKGAASSPEMNLNFSLDSVKYNGVYFGSFYGDMDYLGELLSLGINFKEAAGANETPRLNINGSIPVNLAMNGKDIMIKDKPVDINFVSDKLSLQIFNVAIPMMNNLKGALEANINFRGTFDGIVPGGNLKLTNGSFILAQNNLPYNFGIDLFFDKDLILMKDFYLANHPNTKGGGTIGGTGQLFHRNFVPENAEAYVSGDLKVIGQETKSVSPTLFGDIAIRTNGDIIFRMNEGLSQLKADLTIKRGATLTYSPIQTAFSNENDKFIYVFAETESPGKQDKQIDSLIIISEAVKQKLEEEGFPFDLDIKISVEDEVKAIYVLSREFKQNLTAYLGGNFEYILIDREPTARGELRLLEGSKLEFIKSFDAQGSIQFITEIDNPFLDITASYQNYYNPDTLRTSSTEMEVLIQIKLEGPLKNVNTIFIKNEGNIAVYKKSGRGQFVLDPTKTSADAMYFIILGKFQADATIQETNLAVSTAASLAGSIVGGFLNEQLGDLVRSVEVRQSGTETLFSLVGKAGDFKYEIGGTSQMFQDLSRANVKIEYPIPVTPGLIVRIERRE